MSPSTKSLFQPACSQQEVYDGPKLNRLLICALRLWRRFSQPWLGRRFKNAGIFETDKVPPRRWEALKYDYYKGPHIIEYAIIIPWGNRSFS